MVFGNYIYPNRDYYQSYVFFSVFDFGCLYNSIAIVRNADFPSYRLGRSFDFLILQLTSSAYF